MTRFICLTAYYDGSPIWLNVANIVAIAGENPASYAYTKGARSVVNVLGSEAPYSFADMPQTIVDTIRATVAP